MSFRSFSWSILFRIFRHGGHSRRHWDRCRWRRRRWHLWRRHHRRRCLWQCQRWRRGKRCRWGRGWSWHGCICRPGRMEVHLPQKNQREFRWIPFQPDGFLFWFLDVFAFQRKIPWIGHYGSTQMWDLHEVSWTTGQCQWLMPHWMAMSLRRNDAFERAPLLSAHDFAEIWLPSPPVKCQIVYPFAWFCTFPTFSYLLSPFRMILVKTEEWMSNDTMIHVNQWTFPAKMSHGASQRGALDGIGKRPNRAMSTLPLVNRTPSRMPVDFSWLSPGAFWGR